MGATVLIKRTKWSGRHDAHRGAADQGSLQDLVLTNRSRNKAKKLPSETHQWIESLLLNPTQRGRGTCGVVWVHTMTAGLYRRSSSNCLPNNLWADEDCCQRPDDQPHSISTGLGDEIILNNHWPYPSHNRSQWLASDPLIQFLNQVESFHHVIEP
jgi:hypothetical protein